MSGVLFALPSRGCWTGGWCGLRRLRPMGRPRSGSNSAAGPRSARAGDPAAAVDVQRRVRPRLPRSTAASSRSGRPGLGSSPACAPTSGRREAVLPGSTTGSRPSRAVNLGQSMASCIFLFFACLSPAVTFGTCSSRTGRTASSASSRCSSRRASRASSTRSSRGSRSHPRRDGPRARVHRRLLPDVRLDGPRVPAGAVLGGAVDRALHDADGALRPVGADEARDALLDCPPLDIGWPDAGSEEIFSALIFIVGAITNVITPFTTSYDAWASARRRSWAA